MKKLIGFPFKDSSIEKINEELQARRKAKEYLNFTVPAWFLIMVHNQTVLSKELKEIKSQLESIDVAIEKLNQK